MARWVLWHETSCRGYFQGPPLNHLRGGVSCDEHAKNTRSCCDLAAHGERSAWLAAKKNGQKKSRRSGSLLGLTGNSGSSTTLRFFAASGSRSLT